MLRVCRYPAVIHVGERPSRFKTSIFLIMIESKNMEGVSTHQPLHFNVIPINLSRSVLFAGLMVFVIPLYFISEYAFCINKNNACKKKQTAKRKLLKTQKRSKVGFPSEPLFFSNTLLPFSFKERKKDTRCL